MEHKKNTFMILILFCLFFIHNTDCRADTLIFSADIWCPVNCDPAGSEPGIMVETAQKVFSDAGHTVKYTILPWARAVVMCREGKINGVIGAFAGDAPDFVFPENELLMVSGNTLFTAKNSKWIYKNMNSMEDIKLGAIIGYDYGPRVNNYMQKGKNVQLLGGKNPLERNIQKLLLGRIDAVIEAEPVFRYSAKKMGLADQFRTAGQIDEPQKCYIAFSPNIPKSKEYSKILSDGVDMLRQSGELEKILNKYGLHDWEKTKQ
jgi:polar amino acid transport system substrate-binding protein